MSTSFTCRICGNQKGNIPWTAREMMYGLREEFLYYECANCLCLQIAEFPTDMSQYYPGGYYSFELYDGRKFKGLPGFLKRKQYEYSIFPTGLFKKLVKSLAGIRHYDFLENYSLTRQTRILDAGCGNGRSFLYPLTEIGFNKVAGFDPYLKHALIYPNGLHILKCDIGEVKGEWEIITWHHSFEHISNPLDSLRMCAALLTDGGLCVIRIPTTSSWAWQYYRTNWAQLDAPRHFFLHSRHSIEILAQQAGFRLEKMIYDSTHFQFSGSEKYLKDVALSEPLPRGIFNFIKRKWKKRRFTASARKLNREGKGDQAAFLLRKN